MILIFTQMLTVRVFIKKDYTWQNIQNPGHYSLYAINVTILGDIQYWPKYFHGLLDTFSGLRVYSICTCMYKYCTQVCICALGDQRLRSSMN